MVCGCSKTPPPYFIAFKGERNTMPVTKEPVYASKAQPWMSFYDPKYRDMPVPDCTAFEYVCRQNKGHLADIALNYYGTNVPFATFIVNVKKTAAALRAAGVRKGDIMTAVSVMTPELIYLFYASDMVGATLNLVDPATAPRASTITSKRQAPGC